MDAISMTGKSELSMAQQIANAASAFQQQRTGLVPSGVTVVLSDQTLVITLKGALSAAEKALAKSPTGAAQIQEFHRQLFAISSEPLRQEIRRITGVNVSDATVEHDPIGGAMVQVFPAGTMVQVFLLSQSIAPDTWNATMSAPHS